MFRQGYSEAKNSWNYISPHIQTGKAFAIWDWVSPVRWSSWYGRASSGSCCRLRNWMSLRLQTKPVLLIVAALLTSSTFLALEQSWTLVPAFSTPPLASLVPLWLLTPRARLLHCFGHQPSDWWPCAWWPPHLSPLVTGNVLSFRPNKFPSKKKITFHVWLANPCQFLVNIIE